MLKIFTSIFLAAGLFIASSVQSQQPCTDCGEYRFPTTQCITPQQSAEIKTRLRQQQALLRQQGILPGENDPSQRIQATSFAWPLRLAAGLTDPGYYGISNYIDQNPAFPNLLQDYNCGTRTYDRTNGYNHAGTDIFTWPFGQLKQQNNEVEIIAAAAGTIIDKNDGSPDHSCAFCTTACLWNAVYVQHADGSVAWYGHMKNGSVTTKTIGQTVALGEKLGVVGSSGNSTGPHLHFEVYANAAQTQLIDPWQGTCNNGTLFNAGLKWAAQKPYRESMINRIQVGHQAPTMPACPAVETPNASTQFSPGDVVYMTAFYRDQIANVMSSYSMLQPNGTVWAQWQHASPTTYNASWWFWTNTLPANAANGVWKFTAQLGTQIVETLFNVGPPLPISLSSFSAKATGPCSATMDWTTATETNNKGFHIQRSTDGINFKNAGWVNGSGTSTAQQRYQFIDDAAAAAGTTCKKVYYRLLQEDTDGKTSVSKIVAVQWPLADVPVLIFPNPAKDAITIQGEGLQKATLLDAAGRTIAQLFLKNYATIYPVATLQPGMYSLKIIHTNGHTTIEHFIKN